MAYQQVKIPDGDYCGDKHHFDCMFADHEVGWHMCRIYNQSIGPLETITVNGERLRVRRKCTSCHDKMINNDMSRALIPDKE